ncbi:MAG: protein kinase, partial [Planctomycetota bacterium]
LEVEQAVDLTLQVIEGLEAAARAGILHRDVKPANCFVQGEQQVKVGDFGLSISQLHRHDTNITETGVFLGTPAFASPEQLRGDELDLRSDLYSVGATLFYLLTGKTPFRASQVIQLMAVVLDQPAPSPRDYEPRIPQGLASVILQCLEKRKENRFAEYANLKQALLPYSSIRPRPASFGSRLLAYGFDLVIFWVAMALIPLVWTRSSASWILAMDSLSSAGTHLTNQAIVMSFFGMLAFILYFAVSEWLWAATPGKATCSIRVGTVKGNPPELWQCMCRALVFAVPTYLPMWIYVAISRFQGVQVPGNEMFVFSFSAILISLGLFLTARTPNLFAGIHELVSRTRTLKQVQLEPRPVLPDAGPEIVKPEDLEASAGMLGPYQLLKRIDSRFQLGFDARLLRRVWIHHTKAEHQELVPAYREIERIGRLRWLSGSQNSGDSWEAYEAPTGAALVDLIQNPQPWDRVRFWLADLANELASAAHETPALELQLNRVWITEDGRAKLLHFAAPGVNSTSSETTSAEYSATRFLQLVALASLNGQADGATHGTGAVMPQHPLPHTARSIMMKLAADADLQDVAGELSVAKNESVQISPKKRYWITGICFGIVMLLGCFFFAYYNSAYRLLKEVPESSQVSGLFLLRDLYIEQPEKRDAVVEIMATRHRELLLGDKYWDYLGSEFLAGSLARKDVAKILSDHAPMSAEERERRKSEFAEITARADEVGYSTSLCNPSQKWPNLEVISILVVSVLLMLLLPQAAAVAVFGQAFYSYTLNANAVLGTGQLAGRVRLVARVLVFWTLILFMAAILLRLPATEWRLYRLLMVFVVARILPSLFKERPLHDRLTGVWLVPGKN